MRLAEVVQAWRNADPKHIHPTREHVSEAAYWESGREQAQFVADLLPEGGWVLDFGCGDGRIAIPMAQLGLAVTAVDAAPEMIERLHHNAEVQKVWGIAAHVSDGVNDVVMVDHLGHKAQFDAINARAVFIHHSHTDVIKMVKNLAQFLKPGGFLVADWPIGPHHERRDWIDVTTWEYGHRAKVAAAAGLELVSEGEPRIRPSVWIKR
jgi:2-polyprenyl-3-methyl-5-hydroxy-6-metoxy-1,4-benzoquinol methylase